MAQAEPDEGEGDKPGPSSAGHESEALSEHEQDQAREVAPLSALVVHEVIRDEGEDELKRDTQPVLWSGLAAGLSMGFSFLVMAVLRADLPDAPWRRLVAGLGYTVGFMIVVLGRQQLFTESTITAVLPVLTRRDLPTLGKLLRLWGLVLVANVVGTWLFAAVLAWGRPFAPETAPALSAVAAETTAGSFVSTAIKAVLAGWLIALMVWLLPSARTARVLIIMLITYVVSILQLPHIIAGSSEAAFAVLSGDTTVQDYLVRFFAPTLLGNTVGGVVFTAMLNHAPISDDVRKPGG